jgi:alpha-galactosidase
MTQHVDVSRSSLGSGTRIDAVVRNGSRDAVAAHDVRIPLDDVRASRVLEHGWQSWSVVRPRTPDDVVPKRADLPGWALAAYLSVPAGAGRRVPADQFLVHDGGVAGWIDGRRHVGEFEIDADGSVVAVARLDGVVLAPGEERPLDPLWIAAGEPGPLYSEYASHWGAAAGARTGGRAPFGWCSWYQYFGAVVPDDIRTNIPLAREHGLDLVQIDDGYQAAIGDWLAPCESWAGGVEPVVDDIRAAGLSAGIWTAPFLGGEASAVATAHPEWLGDRAWVNEAWGGWTRALDTTRADVLDWLRETFGALRAAGFDYFKIDFCFAGAVRRESSPLTRAQALRAGLQAVREGIGDDAFLLGCGCPFGPAVGVVDAMRASADVAPSWEPDIWWAGLKETVPAARHAVMASVLRAPLHRRLWLNDPDCALLRPTDTSLTPDDRRALADTVAGTGAFTVVSDDLTRYGAQEWAALERLRSLQARGDAVLDIDDPFADPIVVRGAGGLRLEARWPDLHARLVE